MITSRFMRLRPGNAKQIKFGGLSSSAMFSMTKLQAQYTRCLFKINERSEYLMQGKSGKLKTKTQ